MPELGYSVLNRRRRNSWHFLGIFLEYNFCWHQ